MRPMQRPHKKIIDTIECNLERLNDLTIDALIVHVENLKEKCTK